jgi:hypothetical protein
MVVMVVVMPVLMASWNQRETVLVIVHCIEFCLYIYMISLCLCKQLHDSKLVFHGYNRGWKIVSIVRNEPRLDNQLSIEHIIQIVQLYGSTLLDKINAWFENNKTTNERGSGVSREYYRGRSHYGHVASILILSISSQHLSC